MGKSSFAAAPAIVLLLVLRIGAQATDEQQVVDELVGQMTLDEKINFIGSGKCDKNGSVLRLGIEALSMSDGPHGLASGPTSLPDAIALGATFDRDCAAQFGMILGRECRANGIDMLLGPAINIQRSPLDARINEYYSEDPFLTGELIVPVVRAVQSNDVIAQVKHYVCFNQETSRRTVDVRVDEQALREIYLPHWYRTVVDGEALAIMASYNWIRGQQAAQNPYTLQTVLKGEMGFEGFVMTDWDSRITALESAMNGLDMEVCTEYWRTELKSLVEQGTVPIDTVDDKVRRILRSMYRANMLSGQTRAPAPTRTQVLEQHKDINREIAEASMVLLKNDALLPLAVINGQTIAIVGENAVAMHAPKGSCNKVNAAYEITPLMGLAMALQDQATIRFARGYYDGETIPRNPIHDRYVSAAEYENSLTPAQMRDSAVARAAGADHVVLFGGSNRNYNSCSHADRTDIELHGEQNELIEAVVAVNPNTVVILVGGGPVTMPWLDKVKAVVQMFPAGSEAGNAIANVLLGKTDPSGRLPMTFPRTLEDSPAHAMAAAAGGTWTDGIYREGILVGYRWFDTKGIEPLFAFGHGLSYTTFEYANLSAAPAQANGKTVCRVAFDVTNAGDRPGDEVAQVYVQDVHAPVQRPEKELKGFSKVSFGEAGVSKRVTVDLDSSVFAYYDTAAGAWRIDPGEFRILVGASSRDIRLEQSITWPLSSGPTRHGGVGQARPENVRLAASAGRASIETPAGTRAQVRVIDMRGRTVKTLARTEPADAQAIEAFAAGDRSVGAGVYMLQVLLRNSAGGQTHERCFRWRHVVR